MVVEEWNCWEITGCSKKDNCPAGINSAQKCWDIARQMDNFKSAMNVCEDCLVYLTQQQNSILSKGDVEEILAQKGVCVLAEKCLT